MNHPSPVTVIGLGLMGSALAEAFLANGHPTTVWNRSAGKADDVVAKGAVMAATVGDAIAASPVVVVCVSTYEVVHGLLDPLAETLSGRLLVNLTSGTPEQAREAAQWAAERGVGYLDGAIMSVPAGVGQPDAMVLYGGSPDSFAEGEAILKSLGGATHLSADPGSASLHDTALLSLMWSAMSGFVHAVSLVGTENVAATKFVPLANRWLVTVTGYLTEYARQIDDGKYPADATLEVQLAAMEHVVHASISRGVDTQLPLLIKELVERAIDAGHGADSFASMVEVFRQRAGTAS